jgi:hypothetical protein
MNYLFDYGEFLLCCGPIFLIIAMAGIGLLMNSLPSKESEKISGEEEPQG